MLRKAQTILKLFGLIVCLQYFLMKFEPNKIDVEYVGFILFLRVCWLDYIQSY